MSSVTAAFLLRLWTTMVCLTTMSLPHWFTAQIKEDSLCPEISWKHLIFQHHALLFSIYSPWYKQKHKFLKDRLEKDYINKNELENITFPPVFSVGSEDWELRLLCSVSGFDAECSGTSDKTFSKLSSSIKRGPNYYHIPIEIEKYMLNSQRSKDEQGLASSKTRKKIWKSGRKPALSLLKNWWLLHGTQRNTGYTNNKVNNYCFCIFPKWCIFCFSSKQGLQP